MNTDRDSLIEILRQMKTKGYAYLVKITAVDYVGHLDVLYFIRNINEEQDETVRISIDTDDAWVPTVMNDYPAADWYERELAEMFAIEVRGREAKRLLLEKWDGVEAPLRKSFAWAKPYKSKQ